MNKLDVHSLPNDNNSADPDYDPDAKRRKLVSNLKPKAMEDIKNMLKDGSSNAAILKRYPTLKSESNIINLKNYLDEVLPVNEKLDFIQKHMWKNFKNDQNHGKMIHDVDLQSWAMEGAEIIGLSRFKASKSFIQSFRKRYGLVY